MPAIFSKSCEYAIQSVLYLTRQKSNSPVHLRDISSSLNIPHHFLSKVMQTLGRDGIIHSQKGLSGGFELGRKPSHIYLMDIVHAIDGKGILDECVAGFPNCGDEHPCALHPMWKEAKHVLLEMLKTKTIEDLNKEMSDKWNFMELISEEKNLAQQTRNMKTPTEILKEEHRAIERMLNVLEIFIRRSERGEHISTQYFNNALKFIQLFADSCHHGKEEKFLFPAMERNGFSREMGPLAVMLYEHEEGRSYVREMLDALGKMGNNGTANFAQFSIPAKNFIALLRNHITKEDNILFVMAENNLPEKEKDKLLLEFGNLELAGTVCHQKTELLTMLKQMEYEVTQQFSSEKAAV
ncbi:MAG: Rrf2 family transcriptional regulator [Ignavibacteria bacterium]|nr:Rrf2 family transcriptional regulator [Ignavibacteria bacterium]